MAESSLRERFERNASEIAGTVVTGAWLAALFLGFEWWLPLMLFGYVVVVPVVGMLFDGDEEAERAEGPAVDRTTESDAVDEEPAGTRDALDRLRSRYAEGDLTDEQFERKLDRLLETETPEDAAEYVRRERSREPAREVERE
ncbi:hypothetical protein DJ82_09060 [Halorubrum sp. Ib24]|uniref:SHOCT domain-containing protein n=1 Tax=unclassified Halorubrum TaxID=2642239 RepID=UPI000B97DF20|nr:MULTISPECIES: SHOCT domain-containing protein [unclassified Halorubrum]OYR39639.1 hypothetical protein DJ82_09060 [Halorubrum sp. Ib24]OYR44664.1 hypothetical protein DJ81_06545 [Halorubrum sp. Hd13]OYR47222.1 hypothetical protein DJ75_04780 [Halorubrum sp. Eb13]OYR55108.1 hypothetical protein DJ73_03210 [Halorubrum sp. Ea1]